jgi:MoaA/NifB/PqqE/SkfB family radical SAM enzyme
MSSLQGALAAGPSDVAPVATRRDLWTLHPEADRLLSLGAADVDPPAHGNIVLTNKCNLRCEICGSQTTLDRTKTSRSHMPIEVFRAVARTLFPVLSAVELNSQGDPLLYPQIDEVLETLAEHACELHVQTNGTLFSDTVLERLLRLHGTISLSLDAVGPTFDEVRRRGNWARAEPGMRALFARRDPARLTIWLYPTVTRRTVGEMLNVARWAAEHDIDRVDYHLYSPIERGTEEVPTDAELRTAVDALRDWIARASPSTMIIVEGELLHRGRPSRRSSYASAVKSRFINNFPLYPVDATHRWAARDHLCMAPVRGIDVSMDGTIHACCRAQDVPLGLATSVEAFAEAWLGHNYRVIRDSLRHDAAGSLPLPNCEGCIRTYAPEAAAKVRRPVPYGAEAAPRHEALRYDRGVVVPTLVRRHVNPGRAFTGFIPLGLDATRYRMFEDDAPLPLPDASLEDIRTEGGGRYRIESGVVYFSSTDDAYPLRNGRRYELRRI